MNSCDEDTVINIFISSTVVIIYGTKLVISVDNTDIKSGVDALADQYTIAPSLYDPFTPSTNRI